MNPIMKKNFSVKTIASAIFAATVLFTACNEKSPEALYDSGLRYVKGDGVEKNVEKGVSLLKKSANKGYLPAFRQVGSALMNNGSIQEGLSWCELAIEKGDAKTARDIAHTYYTGNSKYDIQKDYKKAVSLFYSQPAPLTGCHASTLAAAQHGRTVRPPCSTTTAAPAHAGRLATPTA